MELSPEQAMELLGVGRNASFEEIVRAKNRLVEATDDMETVIRVRVDPISTSTRASAACCALHAQGFPACVGYEGACAPQARAKPPCGQTHLRRSYASCRASLCELGGAAAPDLAFRPRVAVCERHWCGDGCEVRMRQYLRTQREILSPHPSQ